LEDLYKTIASSSSEIIFKEKSSTFYGYAFPIESETEVKPLLEILRKEYPHAVHYCYAYQLGTETIQYRANDDGEPSNSAGMPIYRQIQSFSLTNVLIVVVRIFGGIKLGVGGLITAYKTTAQLTLESCEIIEKTLDIHYVISIDYKNMNKVMRIIKEHKIDIRNQKMGLNCEIEISIRKKRADTIFKIFDSAFEIGIKPVL
jgi:uncharacterized YigZ family protein